MQSLILVILSIGAAMAAPQQFFVLPDFLASALTHSGLSHPELVPIVIPIGDHSKQKSEPSKTEFDVFMRVPDGNKVSTVLEENKDESLPEKQNDSLNPVEMVLNELQNQPNDSEDKQVDDSLSASPILDSEITPANLDIHQPAANEDESATIIEKESELESHSVKEMQVTDIIEEVEGENITPHAVPSLPNIQENLETENGEPETRGEIQIQEQAISVHEVQSLDDAKEVVPVSSIVDTDTIENIEMDVPLKEANNQEHLSQTLETMETENIEEESTKHLKDMHAAEAITDDKDIIPQQEAQEEVAVADEVMVEILPEEKPQDVVNHEEVSHDQKIDDGEPEKTSSKLEDKIHEKSSSSKGKTLSQNKIKDEKEVHVEEIVVVEELAEPVVINEALEIDIVKDSQTKEINVEEFPVQSSLDAQVPTEVDNQQSPVQVAFEEVSEVEEEKPNESITLQTNMENTQTQETIEEVSQVEDEKPKESTIQETGEEQTQTLETIEKVPHVELEKTKETIIQIADEEHTRAQETMEKVSHVEEDKPKELAIQKTDEEHSQAQKTTQEVSHGEEEKPKESIIQKTDEEHAQVQEIAKEASLIEEEKSNDSTIQKVEEKQVQTIENNLEEVPIKIATQKEETDMEELKEEKQQTPLLDVEEVEIPHSEKASQEKHFQTVKDGLSKNVELAQIKELPTEAVPAIAIELDATKEQSTDTQVDIETLPQEVISKEAPTEQEQVHITETQIQEKHTKEALLIPEITGEEIPVNSQLTEEGQIQSTHTEEEQIQSMHTEEIAATNPQMIEEAPVQPKHTEETPLQPKNTEEAAVQTNLMEDSVQATQSEDAPQIKPQLTEVVQSTHSDVTAPIFTEVQVKEEFNDNLLIANPILIKESPIPEEVPTPNVLEENQIKTVKNSKIPAKVNVVQSSGKSLDSASNSGIRMEHVGPAVQHHFGFSSNIIRMPEPVQYFYNGAFVDPKALVEPKYRHFFYHNDSPDIVRAKILFFQHQSRISPKF